MIVRLEEQEVTSKLIKALIDRDKADFKPKDDKMRRYYDGEHDIMYRTFSDPTKPNNKIVTNFCKYITDILTGYFIGEPVQYYSINEEFMNRLQEIFNENNEQAVNAQLAKYASVYSRASEIVYAEEIDGQVKIKFDVLNPEEQRVILVYDNSIDPQLVMAVRYYDQEDILKNEVTTHAFVYTRNRIYHYKSSNDGFSLEEEKAHYFGEVPVNPYFNKGEDSKGDFESIITLNDAYNLLQSDDINESNYSNDAYLIIAGMIAEEKDIQRMKENRVIEVTDEGKVEWLIKNINDTWKENLKERIQKDIHKISGTPDMSDERFAGNASGVAIEYKLTPFENNRAAKERAFKRGLQRRIKLITNLLKKQGQNFDYRDIEIKFNKNLPTDDQAMVNQATQLLGTDLVSKDTLRAFIPWIEDPALEKEKIDREKEEDSTYTIDRILDEESQEGVINVSEGINDE